MENFDIKSLTGQVQSIYKTDKDFPQKFKHRLVRQSSHSVTNHFELIVHLYNEELLCDESNSSEATVGLKEVMVQLALMIACSKGADAIGSLMNSLEKTGNSEIILDLRTWLKQDFGTETNVELSETKREASGTQTMSSEALPKKSKISYEMKPSGIELIDNIMKHVEYEFMEELERQLAAKACQLHNVQEFCSSLVNQKVLDVAEIHLTPEVQDRQQRIEKIIQSACSKKAIGSLVIALQISGNERILEETNEWLDNLQARKKNYPVAVRSLARLLIAEESKAVRYAFFEQSALLDGLSKIATFECEQKSDIKGVSLVQFDKERMVACSDVGTLTLWKSRRNEEQIKIADNVKNINSFQYDHEILVAGTEAGTVHLFDVRSLEEKCSVILHEPVMSLKFVESSILAITRSGQCCKVWWLEISHHDMRLLNQRSVGQWMIGLTFLNPDVFMLPDTNYVNGTKMVYVYDTKPGRQTIDCNKRVCYLVPPEWIFTLNVGDLISTKRVVVAGCKNGMVAIWNTSKLTHHQSPIKIFQGHMGAIVSLSFLNGHLIGANGSEKLVMWSVHDLEKTSTPSSRVLMEKSNVTYLASHERWFASWTFAGDIINIWKVPDKWL